MKVVEFAPESAIGSQPGVSALPVPPDEPASSAYWREMSGFNYQARVGGRQDGGQGEYGQQEAFLASLIAAEQQQLDRRLDVLEFGCGFGRHAWYLSKQRDVRYHGYDFSEPMVEPLRKLAPPALEPLSDYLFVGPDVITAVGGRKFDLVFTVSVLIHNPPERLPGLLQQMADLLTPQGTLCLIENQVVPFSVYENSWHQGCWLHRYWDAVSPGWDLHLAHGPVDTHDVYLLRRNGRTDRRLFRVSSPEKAFDCSAPLSESDLDRLGLPKLKKWAADVEPLLKGDLASQRDRLWDQQEVLRSDRERVSRQKALLTLADDLHVIRARLKPTVSEEHAPSAAGQGKPRVELDAPFDIHWSHSEPSFRRVLHLFSQEWHGIRAAAGYLPGSKLAIAAEGRLAQDDRAKAFEILKNSMSRAIVVHGWSRNMYELVQLAKRQAPDLRFFGVFHGSTAQWLEDFEFDAMTSLLEMRRRGILSGLAAVKPGMELLSPHIHGEPLLNVPPHLPEGRSKPRDPFRAALVPVANTPLKNFYTNLYAAVGLSRLRTVFVTAPHRTMPDIELPTKVVTAGRLNRAELFALTQQVDVSLNATLSECQPMTALEALALRVPCITGPLALGELDTHPYQQLAQLAHVDTIPSVREAVVCLLEARESDSTGLDQMMGDYEQRLRRVALDRYGEFLGL